MEAILVVDIDGDSGWEYYTLDDSKQETRKALENMLQLARESGRKIIFITKFPHILPETRTVQLEKNNPNSRCIGCDVMKFTGCQGLAWFLNHRHDDKQFEPVFIKDECDAFTNKSLAAYLHGIGVEEVVLAGCSTFACVLHTAVGAVKNGFRVKVLEKCVHSHMDEREKMLWFQMVQEQIKDAAVNIRFE